MDTLITVAAACKDTYVTSCNPAPKTPASEVVVHRVTEALATTGLDTPVLGLLAVACVLVIGSIIPFVVARKRS